MDTTEAHPKKPSHGTFIEIQACPYCGTKFKIIFKENMPGEYTEKELKEIFK